MASLIPALSLLILVLANGYFTFPVIEEQFINSPFSLFNDTFTTERTLNLQLTSDYETTPSTNTDKRFVEEVMGLQLNSTDKMTEENLFHESRMPDGMTTPESSSLLTEENTAEKRGLDNFTTLAIELMNLHRENNNTTSDAEGGFLSENNKRGLEVELTTTMPTFTSVPTVVVPERFTTESSTGKYLGHLKDTEEYDEKQQELEKTPKKSVKSKTEFEYEESKVKSSNKFDNSLNDKEEVSKIKSSNKFDNNLNEKEEVSKIKSSNKFDNNLNEKEEESKIKSSNKFDNSLNDKEENDDFIEKSDKKSRINSKDKTDEDKELAIPMASLDQNVSNNYDKVFNNHMILDEGDSRVVTAYSSKSSTTTIEKKKGKKPLNQGKESSDAEEKKSDN